MKTKLKSLLLVLAALPLFISCDDKGKEPGAGKPTISFDQTSVEIISHQFEVTGTISYPEGATLEDAKIICLYNVIAETGEVSAQEIEIGTLSDMEKQEGNAYSFTVTEKTGSVLEIASDITGIKITAKVANGETAEGSITLTVGYPAIEWVRAGASNAKGMDKFGLQMAKRNSEVEIYTLKAGSKIVKLTKEDWDGLENYLALREKIESTQESTLPNYSGKSAMGFFISEIEKSIDEVIGVKNGTTYFMIHLNDFTVTKEGNTETLTFKGNYKEEASF